MTTFQRATKQIFFLLIFIVIVGGLSFWTFRTAVPVTTPTPDPIASLSPIKIISSQIFSVQENDFDFLAKVSNSNAGYGSPNVEYELTFFDPSDAQISAKTGSFYILPGQTKYVVDLPIKLDRQASRAEMVIKSVEWQKLSQLALGGINFVARSAEYLELNKPNLFSKVAGSILNSSDFDVNKVDVAIILLDSAGAPIATNKTEINTFLSKTTRSFEVFWPTSFVGKVDRANVEIGTNIFDNSNYIQQYGGQEKFKRYYNTGQ